MKKYIRTTKKYINKFLVNFTLAKLIGALFTVIIVSLIKYCMSGNLHIEYCEFWNNVGIGLLGWTINTGTIGWLTDYLGIKGINFNLNQFLYGYRAKDTIGGGDSNSTEFKPKLYHAMDSDEESGPNRVLDKGKGVDRGNTESVAQGQSETKPLDKGKGIDRRVHPLPLAEVAPPTEPHMVTWSRVFPGLDPASIFNPKKINPGPGFNVPGGEVPLRDDICKHIDYNSHILKQFKTMDLKTAIEQRDNYLKYIEVISQKSSYAQGVLSKQPEVPTNDYQYRLRMQILTDLDSLSSQKVRAEAKATLLNSRIDFIQINRKPDE